MYRYCLKGVGIPLHIGRIHTAYIGFRTSILGTQMTPNTSGFGAAISAAAKGSQWEIALSLLEDLGFCAQGTMDLVVGIPAVHFLVPIILDAMNQELCAT